MYTNHCDTRFNEKSHLGVSVSPHWQSLKLATPLAVQLRDGSICCGVYAMTTCKGVRIRKVFYADHRGLFMMCSRSHVIAQLTAVDMIAQLTALQRLRPWCYPVLPIVVCKYLVWLFSMCVVTYHSEQRCKDQLAGLH